MDRVDLAVAILKKLRGISRGTTFKLEVPCSEVLKNELIGKIQESSLIVKGYKKISVDGLFVGSFGFKS